MANENFIMKTRQSTCFTFGYKREDIAKNRFNRFNTLALHGDAQAQFNLGVLYTLGDGIKKNPEKAFECFKESANQGHATAQYNLAHCYLNGTGVTPNPQEAFNWFKKAALQGLPSAQYNLGLCYDQGIGTQKDHQAAMEWIKKAASKGHARSLDYLKKTDETTLTLDQTSDEESKRNVTDTTKVTDSCATLFTPNNEQSSEPETHLFPSKFTKLRVTLPM